MTPKQSTYSVLEEFSKHDPELIERNVAHVDLSWVAQQQGGEEIENQDISFILERLKWEVTRLANGRINNSTLDRVRKMVGGWSAIPNSEILEAGTIALLLKFRSI